MFPILALPITKGMENDLTAFFPQEQRATVSRLLTHPTSEQLTTLAGTEIETVADLEEAIKGITHHGLLWLPPKLSAIWLRTLRIPAIDKLLAKPEGKDQGYRAIAAAL